MDVEKSLPPADVVENSGATQLPEEKDQAAELGVEATGNTRDARITYFGIFMLMFLIGIYTTMDAVIYYPIAEHFNDMQRANWLINSYLITTTSMQPIYGKCSDIVGRVPTMAAASFFLFIGSLLCAVSNSMDMLIASRAIQGIGSAGMYTIVNVVIGDLFTERERGKLMGYSSSAWSLASAAAVIIGGAIVQLSSWRVAFWLNVAISVAVSGVVLYFLHLPKPSGTRKEKLNRIDFGGSFISLASIVLVLLALSWGGQQYSWSSARVICCIVFGALIGVLFVIYEAFYAKEPILPMYLFKTRNIALAVFGHLFFGAVTNAPLIFIPQWALVVKNTTPITSGLYTLPFSLAEGVSVVINGIIVTKTGRYRECLWFGSICLLVGSSLLIMLGRESPVGHVIGFMIICGFGFGACIQTLILTAQVGAEGKDMATTTTACIFMRSLGSMLVVAVLSSVSENKRKVEFANAIAKFPDFASAITQVSYNQSLIHQLSLPQEVYNQILDVFMKSMRAAFIALVPFSVLYVLIVAGVEHKRLNTVKKVTIQ
ncbi:hypothetical protein FBU59_000195 [Linderina macrospora]|uniref:Uncharacterized protein n=1 Tax=Linderina macrospora TaxID=4868 RepID=A0ACC1JHD3_9FUNG|nr:hypothetical protein FBU59_000195 [Linderina macrospora]